jgi:hypothetical protein
MVVDEHEAERRLAWAVGRMPGMEGVSARIVGEASETRLFWAEFVRGDRTVTAKVPRTLIEYVDIERGIMPLALSDYLRGIMLMLGAGSDENRGCCAVR